MEDEVAKARIKLKDLIKKKEVEQGVEHSVTITFTDEDIETEWLSPTVPDFTINTDSQTILDWDNNPGSLEKLKGSVEFDKQPEHTGGSSSYYTVRIEHPQDEDAVEYNAECIDIMKALNMTVDEVNAFKAIWRTAAARTLKLEKKGNNNLYDAEKVLFAAQNMIRDYKRG